MAYPITRFIGWVILLSSLILFILHFEEPGSYMVLGIGSFWFLGTAYLGKYKFLKVMLILMLMFIVIVLGYRITERIVILSNTDIYEAAGEGSPLIFIIGAFFEMILLSLGLISFIEIIYRSYKLKK